MRKASSFPLMHEQYQAGKYVYPLLSTTKHARNAARRHQAQGSLRQLEPTGQPRRCNTAARGHADLLRQQGQPGGSQHLRSEPGSWHRQRDRPDLRSQHVHGPAVARGAMTACVITGVCSKREVTRSGITDL